MRTRLRPLALCLALAAVALGQVPAAALHGPTGEEFTPNDRLERVYFHCFDDVPLHLTTSGPIPWNTTAPTASVTQGAGCASFDNGLQGNNQVSVQDTHFAGAFAGNLDKITVEVHNVHLGPARQSRTFTTNVRLLLDGESIFGPNGKDVTVPGITSSTGASDVIRFTIVGLNRMDEANDIEHDLLLTLSGGAVAVPNGANPLRDTQSLWVYDTTEVPSGLTFNPATVEAATIAP
ncbi:MAG: hypothetical protein M3245_04820 [Actinomycetota bacterium]|nr:hypothetical protein [Actinomycetota bacterium]